MVAGAKVARILTRRPTCRTTVITRTMRMHNSRVSFSPPDRNRRVLFRFAKHRRIETSTRVREAATRRLVLFLLETEALKRMGLSCISTIKDAGEKRSFPRYECSRYLNYFCRPISHRRSRIIQAVKHESKNTVDDNREYLYNRKRGLIEGYED